MAIMRPELTAERLDNLQSRAEARFYCACRDQLDDSHLVLHSVAWVKTTQTGVPREGEADFIIFHPQRGFVAIEIKGGGIRYDPASGQWYSIDRTGLQHAIKDPFRQASSEKYSVLDQLKASPAWQQTGLGRILIGHAVFFPDVADLARLVSGNSPAEILGGRRHLNDLKSWIKQVFDYWGGRDNRWSPLGPAGIHVVKETFCQPILVKPLIAHQLEEEEIIRIRLTEQQGRLLRALGVRRRAAICGGAGTGKTLLAIQRARELADSGLRTLFLCYNTLLANHLREVVKEHNNLYCMSFHQLCAWRANTVSKQAGLDLLQEAAGQYPLEDRYDVQMPYALARSTELSEERFDAIIVDEAQDFKEDYWLPVELLLADPDHSTLYIFYDQNQAIYTRVSTFPIQDQPFVLTVNCRNTQVIHQAAYRFYQGDPTDPPEIQGTPIDTINAPDVPGQARRLGEHITRLTGQEGLSADQIAVLVCGIPKSHYCNELCRRPLPKNVQWLVESGRSPNTVTVETYHRFKGLEADIVFLWGIDQLNPTNDREALYVSISRAKSRLYLVGTREECDNIISVIAQVQPSNQHES